MNKNRPPLAVIAGPTAAGKSALALALAEKHRGAIINADASQVYADLHILSARPSSPEEAAVPHYIYGVIDGAHACSVAQWTELARAAIADARAAGRLPILVGGTGMYLKALLDGLAPVPPIDAHIRARVRGLPPVEVRAELERADAAMAARLHPNDPQRNARALEVLWATGQSLADWQARTTGGLADEVEIDATLVLPDRAELYARCDARFDEMLVAGALDEAARLQARNLSPDLPVMKALGVPRLLRHLRGEISLAAATVEAKRDTRHYARRQMTWFVSGGQARGWLATARRATP
ncbi:MAG: tRNA (adenosine(37)-N6)-dimethylallyltransferase MiaA [Sphingomonadaceae bacterium]